MTNSPPSPSAVQPACKSVATFEATAGMWPALVMSTPDSSTTWVTTKNRKIGISSPMDSLTPRRFKRSSAMIVSPTSTGASRTSCHTWNCVGMKLKIWSIPDVTETVIVST